MIDMQTISIVAPCFNEEPVVYEFYIQLKNVIDLLPYKFQIIFVDDGSQDRTAEIIRGICSDDVRVNLLSLSRNFGHEAASTCGLYYSTGDAVILIDADLQDPPKIINLFLEEWERGWQVVYGTRLSRHGESKGKLFFAKKFYRVLQMLSDVPIPLDTGDFRLLDREVVDSFLMMNESNRFVRGMTSWLGYDKISVPFERDSRFAGTTKYSLSNLINLAFDGVFGFSIKPLRIATVVGSFFSIGATLFSLIVFICKLFSIGVFPPGYASLIILISFIGGIQLLCIGLIGEYLGRAFDEVKNRPIFVVNKKNSLIRI